MITCSSHDCELRELSVKERVATGEGPATIKVRLQLQLPLEEEDLDRVQHVPTAVAALQEENAMGADDVDSGPSSDRIRCRRRFAPHLFTLARPGKAHSVEFLGSVKGAVEYRAVQGIMAVRMTVEALLSLEDASRLLAMVDLEGTTATIAEQQLDLFQAAA
jgi:hypothetical protein